MKKTWMLLLGLLLLSLALASSLIARKAKVGDIVAVDYTIRLDNGTVYYTTIGSEPAQYTLGESRFLPALEGALIGMREGESRRIRVPAENAYGLHRPELVIVVSKSELPEGVQPTVGQKVRTTKEDGTPLTLVITQVTEEVITLDANNPLAGQNLTFDIELVAIGGSSILTRSNQVTLSWTILALGVAVSGFVFFNSRKGRRLTPVRLSPSFRRLHR